MSAEQQDRVYAIVDGIMRQIAGVEIAEGQTALVLAVAAAIVTTEPDPAQRLIAAKGFAEDVCRMLENEEIVEWIQLGTRPIHPTSGTA